VQLDRTHVVIRARTLSEIGDLAMILVRNYPAASIFGFVLGMLPWLVLNTLLVGWIPWVQFTEAIYDDEMDAELARYLFLMVTLVILQSPIAGVVTTTLIGRAVFEQNVTWRMAIKDVRQMFWRWFWVLGCVRGPVPLMLILATNWGQPLAIWREIVLPLGFLFLAGLQRGRRPFVPEILLLERCPVRSKNPAVIVAGRRTAALHGPVAGELIGRFLTVASMLAVLFLAVLYAMLWARGVLIGRWDWSFSVYLYFVPAALWAAAALATLIRFLSYLDTRIRLEGWEVDLAVRAEVQRQFGDPVGPPVVATANSAQDKAAPRGDSAGKLGRENRGGAGAAITGVGMWLVFGLVATVATSGSSSAEQSDAAGDGMVVAAGIGDDGVTIPTGPTTVWYDADEQELVPVPVKTRLPETQNRDSRWLPKPEKVKAPATAPAGGATGGATGGWTLANVFGWILLAVMAFALIGFLAFLFGQAEPDAMSGNPSGGAATLPGVDDQTLERMKHLPSEVRRTDVNLRDETERLMKLGRLDEAIVLLFGHQLLMLDRCGALRLSRGKTNGRYLRETGGNAADLHRYLRATVTAFESSYFGGHSPSVEQFDRLWIDNQTLEGMVQSRLGVAA
jgi:hypothetical protein